MKSKKYAIYAKKSFAMIKTKKSQRSLSLHRKFRWAARSECNLRYKVLKEIPVVFHSDSMYDYLYIIKQLAEEFEGGFKCLGENTEKYITFSVPFKKEIDNGKKVTYKLKFIDSYRFMSTSLSNLVDNLSGICDKECKKCMERKKN